MPIKEMEDWETIIQLNSEQNQRKKVEVENATP